MPMAKALLQAALFLLLGWNCGTDVRVRQYTQGTFIVDIIDPGLEQSVWRAIIQSRMKGEVQQEQEPYDTAARRIMASFPPY